MEKEYLINIELINGKKEELVIACDADLSRDEVMATTHQEVMKKFGDYYKFILELI